MTYHVKNLILVAFITFQIIESNSKGDSNWPSWRGITGNGSAPDTSKPPREWSEEKNILWKLKTEGLGHSTPIVWENKLYYTSAIPVGEKRIPPVPDNAPGSHDNLPVSQSHHFIAVCVDKRSGNKETRTVIIDHTGERSLDVAAFFIGHGLNRTVALAGGIDNYSKEVDSSIPRYRIEIEPD